MNGMTAREQRSAPTYFTLKSCSKSSSMTVSNGPVAVAEPPGADPLLTRMCRPPSCCAASATMRSTGSLLVKSAAAERCAGSSRQPAPAPTPPDPLFRATIATSTPSRANARQWLCQFPGCRRSRSHAAFSPRSMGLSQLGGVTAISWLHCSLFSLREPGARGCQTQDDVWNVPTYLGSHVARTIMRAPHAKPISWGTDRTAGEC